MSVSIMLTITVIEAVVGKKKKNLTFYHEVFSYPPSLFTLVKISFSYQRALKHGLNYTVNVHRDKTLWDLPVTYLLLLLFL